MVVILRTKWRPSNRQGQSRTTQSISSSRPSTFEQGLAVTRNLDRRGTPCRLFGAENPDQPAESTDDEGDRAKQQRNIDAFIGHQSGISERQPHGGLANTPAGN